MSDRPSEPSAAAPADTSAPKQSSSSEAPRYFTPPSDSPANDFVPPPAVPKVTDAIKLTSWERIQELPSKPCVREAFLNGMGAGFAIGGLRFVVGAKQKWSTAAWKSYGWAIWSFVGVSLVSREFCLRRKALEKEYGERAAAIIRKKLEEKEEKARLRKEEADRKRAEELARVEAEKKKWYKPW